MSTLTLSERLWLGQTEQRSMKKLLMVVIGTIALAISAKIQITTVPVPVTLQVLVIMSIGAAYGTRLAALTVGAYLMSGFVGLPVFAGAVAGPLYVAGPTGGYLIGFLLAAAIVGALAERGWDRTPHTMLAAMAVGLLAIYIPGVVWLVAGSNALLGGEFAGYGWENWYKYGVKTFIWIDAIKLAVAVIAFPTIWKWIGEER